MFDRFMTRQSLFIVVYNRENEILLQQRASKYLIGYWDFPSGHVEYGEDMRGSAVRELAEETGLTAMPDALKLIHIDQYFIEVDYVNYVFELRDWQGEPKILEPEKCSNMGWFSLDKLPDKCVNTVRATERGGFGHELTFSVTNRETYADIMHESFRTS